VGLKNVSKDTDKRVMKLYKSAIVDIAEQNFHENIVENPIFLDDTDEDSFNTSVERSSRQSRADLTKKDPKIKSVEKNKQSRKPVENDSFADEYEVEKIIDKREILGNTEFLVKWKGWENVADRTWEPVDNLEGAEKLIVAYEKVQNQNESVDSKKKTVKDVVVVEDMVDDDYEVESILDKRGKGKKVEYFVKWKNFDKVEERTWEPLENLTESSEIVEAFEKVLNTKATLVLKEQETPPSLKHGFASVTPENSLGSTKRGRPKAIIVTPVKVDDKKKEKHKKDETIEELLDDYEVEKILDKRGKGKKLEYLVKWKNFEKEEDQTWEPMDNLAESREIVALFEKKLMEKKEETELKTPTQPSESSKQARSHSLTAAVNDVEETKELEDDYEVEKILEKRGKGKKLEYLVKWKNFEKEEDQTWEPMDNLAESREIVELFEKELFGKKANADIIITPKKVSKREKSNSVTPSKNGGVAEEKDEYEVEKILNVREAEMGREYLVKWKGWEKEEDQTWEPENSLKGSKKLMKEFEKLSKQSSGSLEASGSKGRKKKIDASKVIVLDDSKDDDVSMDMKTSADSEDLPLSSLIKEKKRGRPSKSTAEENHEEEEDAEYEVEKILDHKYDDGVVQYLVKWKNWNNDEDNTWEPSDNLVGSESIIEKYEKKQKLKKKEEDESPAIKSTKKKKKEELEQTEDADDADDANEYEVEKIVDKRILGGVTEYLVKWKGWENEDDRTWEPEENLVGSEKIIKKFEVSESKPSKTKKEATPKKQSTEDGVVLCVSCNRIFLSCEALRSHEKNEHNKKPSTPKVKKVANEVRDEIEKDADEKVTKRKRSISGESLNLKCYSCGLDSKSKVDLKNHVLSHYYADFYAILPASKPFTCPTCSMESRDRISLVRHFAFTHKEIYKYCTHEQLTNSPADDSALDNEEKNGDDSFKDQSPVYKPGPKSKKLKIAPFSDETLVSDESKSPPRSDRSPVRRVGEIKRASDQKRVDLTDSSDDEILPVMAKKDEIKSFDDLFSESSVAPEKITEAPKVIFNKDSDDESEGEKGHADVDELMGGSDDDKSVNGDNNSWDLENI